jgi:hypothetical protein
MEGRRPSAFGLPPPIEKTLGNRYSLAQGTAVPLGDARTQGKGATNFRVFTFLPFTRA